MKKINFRSPAVKVAGLALAVVLTVSLPGLINALAAPIPTISILDVIEDTSVTIQTFNYPANKDFVVTMGAMGTKGVGGIVVTTINSGTGGTFTATFNIPAGMHGSYQIAIRLQDNVSGYYSYNWFVNKASAAPPPGYTGIPTFSIVDVVEDTTVTVQTNNFPPNKDFVVTMGAMGTKGVGGTVVDTTNSGAGGTFTATYNIPAGLHGSGQIAIRFQDNASGYYAYNWFVNSAAAAPPALPGYSGIPTISIIGVEKDNWVAIQTHNFPAGMTFTVRMGPMGSKGVGGTVVGTVDSGVGGSFTVTFNIPAGLQGSGQISIRLDSGQGYYSFNWFYNNDAP